MGLSFCLFPFFACVGKRKNGLGWISQTDGYRFIWQPSYLNRIWPAFDYRQAEGRKAKARKSLAMKVFYGHEVLQFLLQIGIEWSLHGNGWMVFIRCTSRYHSQAL